MMLLKFHLARFSVYSSSFRLTKALLILMVGIVAVGQRAPLLLLLNPVDRALFCLHDIYVPESAVDFNRKSNSNGK